MHIKKNDQTQAATAIPSQFCNDIRRTCYGKREKPKNKTPDTLTVASQLSRRPVGPRVQSLQSSGTWRDDFARTLHPQPHPPPPPDLPPK